MDNEFLAERRHGLEESFFHKHEAEVLAQLRAKKEKAQEIEAIRDALRLDDTQLPELPERLWAAGVRGETAAALALVPLVAVAWADGTLDAKEADAILRAAEADGVKKGSAAHTALLRWMESPVGDELVESWSAYTSQLLPQLPPADRNALRTRTLDRASAIARAAGGVLGVGSVSPAETRVLERLSKVF